MNPFRKPNNQLTTKDIIHSRVQHAKKKSFNGNLHLDFSGIGLTNKHCNDLSKIIGSYDIHQKHVIAIDLSYNNLYSQAVLNPKSPNTPIIPKQTDLLGLMDRDSLFPGLTKSITFAEYIKHIAEYENPKVETYPELNFEEFTGLSVLNLSYNQLQTPPTGLELLTELTELNISNNKLLDLGTIEKCKTLTALIANNNVLTELPENIGDLENLFTLNLSNNQITELPDSLEKTKASIHISNNYLTNVSEGIFDPPKVANWPREWDLRANPLDEDTKKILVGVNHAKFDQGSDLYPRHIEFLKEVYSDRRDTNEVKDLIFLLKRLEQKPIEIVVKNLATDSNKSISITTSGTQGEVLKNFLDQASIDLQSINPKLKSIYQGALKIVLGKIQNTNSEKERTQLLSEIGYHIGNSKEFLLKKTLENFDTIRYNHEIGMDQLEELVSHEELINKGLEKLEITNPNISEEAIEKYNKMKEQYFAKLDIVSIREGEIQNFEQQLSNDLTPILLQKEKNKLRAKLLKVNTYAEIIDTSSEFIEKTRQNAKIDNGDINKTKNQPSGKENNPINNSDRKKMNTSNKKRRGPKM